jgi:hypothetical protein
LTALRHGWFDRFVAGSCEAPGFPARCEATSRGLRLRSGLRFDDWQLAGAQISRISSASTWWLGDWVNYGEHAYGSRYKAALEVTALDAKTLRNYAWVARRFDMSRRRDTLSFQHHAEVAGLAAAEQELWLTRAERDGWSRNALRRALAADHARRDLASRGQPLVLRIEIAAAQEQRWRTAAMSVDQDLSDWIAAAADDAADAALADSGRGQVDSDRPLRVAL